MFKLDVIYGSYVHVSRVCHAQDKVISFLSDCHPPREEGFWPQYSTDKIDKNMDEIKHRIHLLS